jgi:hypothetical protein
MTEIGKYIRSAVIATNSQGSWVDPVTDYSPEDGPVESPSSSYPGTFSGETGGSVNCTNYSPADPGTTGSDGSSVTTTSPATACTVVTNVINGGLLTVTAPANVSATPDDLLSTAGDQVNAYSIPLATGDNTGSGNGWSESISQSPFSDTHGHGLGTSAISAVTVANISNSTNTAPTEDTDPITVPIAVPSTTPGAIFQTADLGTGLGNFLVTPTVEVNIPANTYAGIYTATAEVDLTQGP